MRSGLILLSKIECISTWLSDEYTCPVCRKPVKSEEDDFDSDEEDSDADDEQEGTSNEDEGGDNREESGTEESRQTEEEAHSLVRPQR